MIAIRAVHLPRSEQYSAHRLARLYQTGWWPPAHIDHVNLDKADNRWSNLRAATRSLNGANRFRQANNSSGFKGVHRRRRGKNYGLISTGRHARAAADPLMKTYKLNRLPRRRAIN